MKQELAIWTDADAAPRCGEIAAALADVATPISVGGPRAAALDQLARTLACPCVDDLRKLLSDHPPAILLLAGTTPVAPADIQTALAQRCLLAALEPVAVTLNELLSLNLPDAPAARLLALLPTFADGPGLAAAADPLPALGHIESLAISLYAQTMEGSLAAHLYDAFDTLLRCADLPDTIDASFTGPLTAPPHDARMLIGHLHLHARLPGRASAVMHLSTQAVDARRRLRIAGSEGHLQVSDTGYTLHDRTGKLVDGRDLDLAPPSRTELIVRQLRRTLDIDPASSPAAPVQRRAWIVACMEAALLSCRTGQSESPRRLLAMHGL